MTEAPPDHWVGTDLLVGWDRRDITPDHPVPLAGFAARAALGPATEVVSPLHLRTIALQHPGAAPVVIMVADLLWWGPDNMARLHADVAAAHGLAPEQLIVQGTHTHSGPQPSDWFSVGLGVVDPDWVDVLHRQAVASIGAALTEMVPVGMDFAQGHYSLGIERRFVRSGGKERAAELSELLSVITFRGADGAAVATLFHHACHPTYHHGNAVSADFPGAAMASLEAESEIALYLQGCCGNVNPPSYRDGRFQSGNKDDLDRMGGHLADAVRALQPTAEPIAARLATDRADLDLPTEPSPDIPTLEAIAAEESLMRSSWAQLLLDRPERRTGAPMRLSKLVLGEGVQLLGLSAEVTSPYANSVTEALGERTLTLGYSNGMLCYVASAMQQEDGGYEVEDAPYWFGLPGRFTSDLEPILTNALIELGRTRTDDGVDSQKQLTRPIPG